MNLRDSIRAALAESGLTQSELAQRAKVPQSNLSEYLAGNCDLNGETIDRLLAALGLCFSCA